MTVNAPDKVEFLPAMTKSLWWAGPTFYHKINNLNFHPLEVVSRWRNPQLQVGENYPELTKCRLTQILLINARFYL